MSSLDLLSKANLQNCGNADRAIGPTFRQPCSTALICCVLVVQLISSPMCRSEESAEMLKNPSFEMADRAGILYWQGDTLSVSPSKEFATEGELSACIVSEGDELNPILTQNVTQFSPHQKYRLQYEARAKDLNQEYRVYVGIWQGENWLDGVATGWRKGQDVWEKVSIDFILQGATEGADRLMVVLQVKGQGTVWFDNTSLTPASEEVEPKP